MKEKRTLKHADDLFPSVHLKPSDLEKLGAPVEVEIDHIDLAEFTDPETKETEEKPILHLVGLKPLILNKTNSKRLAAILGPELETWNGKKVRLGVMMVESFGETTAAIRVL